MDDAVTRMLTSVLSSDQSELDPHDQRVLEATLFLVSTYGVKRTTMDDIASRSKISRATLFRRYGSKDAIVALLFEKELHRFVTELNDAAALSATPVDVIADLFALTLRWARTHPLVSHISEMEPDVLVRLGRLGEPSPLALVRGYLASLIESRGWPSGALTVSAEDLSDVLVHLAFAYALLPESVLALGDESVVRGVAAAILAGPR